MTRRKNKIFKIDILLVFLIIIASSYFIYNILLFVGVEDLIRYVVVALVIAFNLFLILKTFKHGKRRLKLVFRVIKRLLLLMYIAFIMVVSHYISTIYQTINNLNQDISKSTSLVTLSSNKVNDIEEVKDSKIAIVDMKEDVQAYKLPQEVISKYSLEKNNEIVFYNLYTEMIHDLEDEKVDYIFLPTNYIDIFGEDESFDNLAENTKIIITKTRSLSKSESELLSTSKKLTEPFTILLLGVDSTIDGLKNADSFNGDSIILVTYNPKTLTSTMLSIPRDSYVPISCFAGKMENKITHAAGYGTKCVTDTISNFTGIKIDYYMKINFTGLVDLVDAVGGIDVDVPYALCEQDSKRRWGRYTVFVQSGMQNLNGEQALALSRNRHSPNDWEAVDMRRHCPTLNKGIRSDFARGRNQQTVVKAILNSMKDIKSIDQANSVLDSISKNIDTNMNTKTILSFYDVLKDITLKTRDKSEIIHVQRLHLTGHDQRIFDERANRILYNYVLNKNSVKDVSNAMKANLSLSKKTMIKSFSYSNGENYQTKIIGTGPYSSTGVYALLPDFTKMTRLEAEQWASRNNFKIIWEEVENEKLETGVIISQSYPANKRLDLITTNEITLTIVKNTKIIEDDEDDEDVDPDDEIDNNDEDSNLP